MRRWASEAVLLGRIPVVVFRAPFPFGGLDRLEPKMATYLLTALLEAPFFEAQ